VDDSVLLAIPVVVDMDVDVSLHVFVLVTTATLHRPALKRDLCIAFDYKKRVYYETRSESSVLCLRSDANAQTEEGVYSRWTPPVSICLVYGLNVSVN
jgi:hypothetical protein